MSDGIKVTSRTFRGQPVPSTQSIDATYSGDDADWDGTPGEGGFDQWKQPVVAATTGNITIATALNAADTLDGVTLAAGDRVLVKDQSTASQNGIYIVGTTPARADDMDEDAEVVGAVVTVTGGTVNAGRVYRTTNATDPVVDTDAIVWATAAEPTADAHIADTSDAHDASAISVLDSGGYFTGSDVEAALQELGLASASALTNPMTTAGDIIVGAASGTPDRLAATTDGYVLTLASGTPAWAASASGFSDPMTTRGDIIVRGASGTTRLALGASGYVLTSDGTDAGWAAASGGGGTNAPDGKPWNYTPPSSANAKDDEFADASGQSGPTNGLDAKWSKRNFGTASWLQLDDTYAPGALGIALPTGQSTDQYIYQSVPAGDFVMQVRFSWLYWSDRQMWGPAIVDTSGNGVAIFFDSGDTSPILREVSSWQQTATGTSLTPTYGNTQWFYRPVTAWISKSGNDYTAAATYDDRAQRLICNGVTRTKVITAAYVGFGRGYGGGASRVVLDYFRIS